MLKQSNDKQTMKIIINITKLLLLLKETKILSDNIGDYAKIIVMLYFIK